MGSRSVFTKRERKIFITYDQEIVVKFYRYELCYIATV